MKHTESSNAFLSQEGVGEYSGFQSFPAILHKVENRAYNLDGVRQLTQNVSNKVTSLVRCVRYNVTSAVYPGE